MLGGAGDTLEGKWPAVNVGTLSKVASPTCKESRPDPADARAS